MSVESWTLDALVEAYKQHLRRTRGLRETTLDGYGRLVRRFVREALGEDLIDPSRLCNGDVVAFMAVMQSSFSPASMKASVPLAARRWPITIRRNSTRQRAIPRGPERS